MTTRLSRLGASALLFPLLAALALPALPGGSPDKGPTRALAAQTLDGTGAVATGLLLRKLDGNKRVLMIAAHPDDEDTSLLTELARGQGAETAYLSLTRGDGGQNLIGPELWEGLGIIRSGELEAARSLDGGRQYFTRAVDFGYSKTAEESLTFWPREEILRDVVWVVRSFRPHVVVTVFSGTPADGHGQHQATGIIAREAFEAAGDPTRFPEQLDLGVEAWTPSKLYQSAWRDPEGADLEIPTGEMDPLLGRSLFQLAMESRSQHRSQDMGASRPPGPRSTRVALVESRVEAVPGDGLFAGIDTTLVGLADEVRGGMYGSAPSQVEAHLRAYRGHVEEARAAFGLDTRGVAEPLADALARLREARDAAGNAASLELTRVLDRKTELTTRAWLAASGVQLDLRAADDLLIPGQRVEVEAQIWNGSDASLAADRLELALPEGWEAEEAGSEGLGPDGAVAPGTLATATFGVRIPEGASPSEMYYLEADRDGAMYRWPDDPSVWGLPRDPAPVHLDVQLRPAGEGVVLEARTSWRFVGVDQATGEYSRPVLVVPALSAEVTPDALAWPQERDSATTVTVAVRNFAPGLRSGRVRLDAPEGWQVEPEGHDVTLEDEGAERSVTFRVAPTDQPAPGEHRIRAVVETGDGQVYDRRTAVIDYEHIPRTLRLTPAETGITVVPVRLTDGLEVGYIMGTGDAGPEALRQMGARVTLLGPDEVRSGAFDAFDVLVVGVRAYETREDVTAANQQILDWTRAGGTVVVQYQQYQFARGGYAPYPMGVGGFPAPRVSDETAPVTFLEPDSPALTTPNRITQDDFQGWAQERGLYFWGEWDERYTPVLEMNDPGEPPRQGSLLVAEVGEGLYVYAALSFFRQWPTGVPGAYRLFANLVSLDGEDWRAWQDGR